jgi:hypothetical protein
VEGRGHFMQGGAQEGTRNERLTMRRLDL